MSILFGHNHFVIRQISPSELGLQDHPNMQHAEFQLLQRYAHLYFIPVFPIGQAWALSKNGKKYELTHELKQILKARYPAKIHIGSFALPIIAVLGIIGFTVFEKIGNYRREKMYAENLEKKGILFTKQLDSINNDHTAIISFRDAEDMNTFTYCVARREGDRYLLKKFPESEDYGTDSDMPSFIRYNIRSNSNDFTSDSIWINKDDLKRTIAFREPFTSPAIKGLGTSSKLSGISIIRDAFFQEETPQDALTSMYREYVNYGKNAVIDSLVPVDKTEEWNLSQTKTVNFRERFAIKTGSQKSAFLYYHTVPDHKRHKLRVTDHRIENRTEDENRYLY